MKLPLKEPSTPRYLYISSSNTVHVFMPVVGGTDIGTDNTCKAVYSLQEFFGRGSNSNQKATLKGELLVYQEALEDDLSVLHAGEPLAQEKQERLIQIKAWLDVLKAIEQHGELNCLNLSFPSYPRPLEAMMQDRDSANVYSMILRPSDEDGYLRLESANPVFSVAHKSIARNIERTTSALQQAFLSAYIPLTLEAKGLKAQAIRETQVLLEKLPKPVTFEKLRTIFQERLSDLTGQTIDLTKTADGEVVNKQFLDQAMNFNTQTTYDEYMNALLGYCVPHLFATTLESPFNLLDTAEHWCVASQFLLGLANIYAHALGKLSQDSNWGQFLDEHPALSQELAQTLAEAQKNQDSIETVCLSWLNVYAVELKLKTSLDAKDLEAIKAFFAQCYQQIKNSPHFDEFLIFLKEQPGAFVTHQASICTSFATFASHPLFDLSKELFKPLERAQAELSRLSTEIPHSPRPKAHISLDITNMAQPELQALYEQINAHKDPKIKAQLIAELKQERPDFKPQIDPKKFLQMVAYGEQDEAQALLQEDSDRAQELLTTCNTSFTDYSGRTFQCTAYEYAFWAKDSHMCRMLERYMDEPTKQILLERVLRIEEPVRNGLFKAPRGLTYTQKGTAYNSAHFDLTPLEQALRIYINAYNQSLKSSNADWEALDTLWIKVGLPQREVPAHIAQEYCHPERSFKDVSTNSSLLDASNPANLKRQLQFYNFETSAYDVWFSRDSYSTESGLGFSFGILRGARPAGVGGRRGAVGSSRALVDLSAIEAIDRARTEDLKQSLANLAAGPTLESPLTHGR